MTATIDAEKIERRKQIRETADEVFCLVADITDSLSDDDTRYLWVLLRDGFARLHDPIDAKKIERAIAERQSLESSPKKVRWSHVKGVVWVTLEGIVTIETEKAIGVRGEANKLTWFPKSMLAQELSEGDEIDGLWCKQWFADKQGLEYEGECDD